MSDLPQGLPELPPVPDGYDRWEYRGEEWSTGDVELMISFHSGKPDGEWAKPYLAPARGKPIHYIEAVKAAPADDAGDLGDEFDSPEGVDDGGQFHPLQSSGNSRGISVRMWLAGQAMNALLIRDQNPPGELISEAFWHADALIAADRRGL